MRRTPTGAGEPVPKGLRDCLGCWLEADVPTLSRAEVAASAVLLADAFGLTNAARCVARP